MTRLAFGCAALLILGACGGDSDDSGTSSGSSGAASSTTDPATSDGSSTSGGTTTDASSTSAGETSSGGADTSSSGGSESSTGTPSACEPVVPGDWNACFDENGNPSPVLCNWMGTGKSVGSAGCLSGPTEGSNVCMIRGCEDDCDCFAPPQTGDAPVECREVLEGGGMACILNCADGQTCPDDMTCDGGLCFHFPE